MGDRYASALLRRVGDFSGAGGEKLLKLFSFIRFQFPGCLSGLRLKLRCFGLDVSQLRAVTGLRRRQRLDVAIDELSVRLHESVHVRIGKRRQVVREHASGKRENGKHCGQRERGHPHGAKKRGSFHGKVILFYSFID
jgi:hypothetical protein